MGDPHYAGNQIPGFTATAPEPVIPVTEVAAPAPAPAPAPADVDQLALNSEAEPQVSGLKKLRQNWRKFVDYVDRPPHE